MKLWIAASDQLIPHGFMLRMAGFTVSLGQESAEESLSAVYPSVVMVLPKVWFMARVSNVSSHKGTFCGYRVIMDVYV